MSTHAHIGIKDNKHIKYIYNHFDGYPEHVGKLLLEYYNNKDKINALISLGDISSLGSKLEPNEPDNLDDVVVAYHRDRGEELVVSTTQSLKDFAIQEFNYLYDFADNEWYLITDTNFQKLTDVFQHYVVYKKKHGNKTKETSFKTEHSAWAYVKEELQNPPYIRWFEYDNVTTIDYGSHDTFYVIKKESSLQQEDEPRLEQTFIIIKPDAMHLNLTTYILDQIDNLDECRIVKESYGRLKEETVKEHYAHLKDKPFFDELVDFMTSRPVYMAILEGPDIINRWRNLLGATNPSHAAVGTLRQKFGQDVMHNVAHGSDSVENANREIKLWFNS